MKIFGLQIKLNINFKKIVNGLFQSEDINMLDFKRWNPALVTIISVKKSTKRIQKDHILIFKNNIKTKKL